MIKYKYKHIFLKNFTKKNMLKKIVLSIFLIAIALYFFQPNQIQATPQFSYRWISQSSYPSLFPGESTRLWVLVENTGDQIWDENIPIHLATDHPTDRVSQFYSSSDWLSSNRAAWLTEETIVKPQERAVFMFDITAPSTPGTYREYFRPVVENISWLEDYGIFWDITVKSIESVDNIPQDPQNNYSTDGIYRSELISQGDSEITLTQGETTNQQIIIKNIGTADWHNTGNAPIRLATAKDWDHESVFTNSNWLNSNRAASINESIVSPAGQATYNLSLTAPVSLKPGIYQESFQSVAENVTWFQDYNIDYEITVRSTDPKYGTLITNNKIDTFLDSNDIITITDLALNQSFQVKALGMDRWHSDVVPLTKADTQIIRNIYNFTKEFVPYCPDEDWILWQPDAVTIEISSDPLHRKIAAAIDGCAHDIDGGITDNDFPGHFDLHFLDSMMHGKEEVDCSFQKMVQKAAGNPDWATYGQTEPCWNPCVGGGC